MLVNEFHQLKKNKEKKNTIKCFNKNSFSTFFWNLFSKSLEFHHKDEHHPSKITPH